MVEGDSVRLAGNRRRRSAWPAVHRCTVSSEERAMSKQQIIRAWKDENYRLSLSQAERAALPENPVGRLDLDELTAAEMAEIDGGYVLQSQECTNIFFHCTYLQ